MRWVDYLSAIWAWTRAFRLLGGLLADEASTVLRSRCPFHQTQRRLLGFDRTREKVRVGSLQMELVCLGLRDRSRGPKRPVDRRELGGELLLGSEDSLKDLVAGFRRPGFRLNGVPSFRFISFAFI